MIELDHVILPPPFFGQISGWTSNKNAPPWPFPAQLPRNPRGTSALSGQRLATGKAGLFWDLQNKSGENVKKCNDVCCWWWWFVLILCRDGFCVVFISANVAIIVGVGGWQHCHRCCCWCFCPVLLWNMSTTQCEQIVLGILTLNSDVDVFNVSVISIRSLLEQ